VAWDPDADVDALVKKFCDARYGVISRAQAAVVLLTLQDVTRNTCSVPHVAMKPPQRIESDRARMGKMCDAVPRSADAENDPSFKYNLQRLGLMCTYAHRDLEIQHLRATSAPREQIVDKATALHAWVKSTPTTAYSSS